MPSLAGVVLMRRHPIDVSQHRDDCGLRRQLAMSYVVALAVAAGLTVTARMTPQRFAYARTDPGADGQLTSQRWGFVRRPLN